MTICRSKRNKRIRIERLTGTADAHGQINQTLDSNWTPYESAFASVISKGGTEFWKVQQTNADVSHVWKCDWTKAMSEATPDMRLVSEDVVHQILSVIDIDLAHQEIEIQTRRPVK